ncbi:MAG: segregation/condensation protein A [Planctomycetaceae bacterium]|nr:segregation/condensation protein A [Planctomycetaceae bacterium]
MSDYRVNLDIYAGPLDLLLYLIRRDEVDIHNIPIARITQQYIEHVEVLKALDPNVVGDFLVLAATLMEIKTRMLLPAPPPEEGGEEGLEIDPRAELVRQLLQYKAFKDAAFDLADAAAQQAMKFPRRPGHVGGQDESALDLEDVQIWDLLSAFGRLMDAIGQTARQHEVIYDDTPQELHSQDILDRLAREGALSFSQIFHGRTSRSEIIGLFLALLELVRQKSIIVGQDANFGEIQVVLNPDPPTATESTGETGATHNSVVRVPDHPDSHPESMGETPMPPQSMGETPMPPQSMGEAPMPQRDEPADEPPAEA